MVTHGDGPLLVFGARSLDYDFGPRHPLSPRRFGPGIDLLRAVGAEPGLAPEPAADSELEWLHAAAYLAAVRRFSADPDSVPEAGIGPGDDPAFEGMHEAAATVAGGSIRAVEAVLRGDYEHAYHPGGGLHHAMRTRASGFCIYNDVALAIARARRDGLRVLYVDLDVHHGDGVQALHYSDPNVLTISFHESGRSLFPGTGFVGEIGEGTAAGTAVNVPFEPSTGPDAWLAAIAAIVPPLAAAFGPDIVVSQHGADGHAWDPLAHLALTTTAMGAAARLVDRVAHRYAGGRWLATGGGGYSVYRVVPRAWALTWLAGAHRDIPDELPNGWRARWERDAANWDDAPLPIGFEDAAGVPPERSIDPAAAERAGRTVSLVKATLVPALLDVAESRGWWRFGEVVPETGTRAAPAAEAPPARPEVVGGQVAGGQMAGREAPVRQAEARAGVPIVAGPTPTIMAPMTRAMLAGLTLAARVVAPADPAEAAALLDAALGHGAIAAGAANGELLVGVALSAPSPIEGVDRLLALGVAPEWRRRGVATALLRAVVEQSARAGRAVVALQTVADRDHVDPLPRAVRRGVAERLATSAGMVVDPAPSRLLAVDPDACVAVAIPPDAPGGLRVRIEVWLGGL
jgi:acetoin utilization protein AcuC